MWQDCQTFLASSVDEPTALQSYPHSSVPMPPQTPIALPCKVAPAHRHTAHFGTQNQETLWLKIQEKITPTEDTPPL